MTEEASTPKEEKTPEQLIEEMEAAQEPISRDDVKDSFMDTPGAEKSNSNVVPIVAIIAGAVIVIACMFACAAIAAVFLSNPPW